MCILLMPYLENMFSNLIHGNYIMGRTPNAESDKTIKIKCNHCNKEVLRWKKESESRNLTFCSSLCALNHKKLFTIIKPCSWCSKEVLRWKSQLSESGRVYCNASCAAKYNNTHKTKGTRVSKLEKYLQEQLVLLYPNIVFKFNAKDDINSELDIYIPELKLAFELNGIFHYEPIYGAEKLSQIQNNDDRKFQACLERNIELVIIDTSSLTYFKIEKVQKYLNIIIEIINKRI